MRLDVLRQGSGNGSRTAQRNRPSLSVPQCSEHQPCSGGGEGWQVGHGVGSNSAEQGRGGLFPEPGIPQSRTLFQCPQTENPRGCRVPGESEKLVLREVHDVVDVPHKRAHQPPVGRAVPPKSRCCPVQRPVGKGGASAVQR
jgi:hypothetical protein